MPVYRLTPAVLAAETDSEVGGKTVETTGKSSASAKLTT